MAETMNCKAQFAVARVEVPAKRNDALKPCHAGSEELNMALLATFRRSPRAMESAMQRGNRLILLAD
jgi:hypothetical protein